MEKAKLSPIELLVEIMATTLTEKAKMGRRYSIGYDATQRRVPSLNFNDVKSLRCLLIGGLFYKKRILRLIAPSSVHPSFA